MYFRDCTAFFQPEQVQHQCCKCGTTIMCSKKKQQSDWHAKEQGHLFLALHVRKVANPCSDNKQTSLSLACFSYYMLPMK